MTARDSVTTTRRALLQLDVNAADSRSARAAEDEACAALTHIVTVVSATGGPANAWFDCSAAFIRTFPSASQACWQLRNVGARRVLSLCTSIAVCRISQDDFRPTRLNGSEVLIDAILGALQEYKASLRDDSTQQELGTAIDIWSQASGIPVDNPTGRWHMQMDALRRGWRRPRLGRAYWTTTKLPTSAEYARALLQNVPEEQQVLCLEALVREGMNRELALEVAAFLSTEQEHHLAAALARPRAAPAAYPPLVQQAVSLSRSVMKLTQRLVTGQEIRVTDAERIARLEACTRCDAFDADSYRCQHCGCYLKAKLPLATEHCPIGHW